MGKISWAALCAISIALPVKAQVVQAQAVNIGPRTLHAAGSREVHGKRFWNGTIAVSAGTGPSIQQYNPQTQTWSGLTTALGLSFHRTELLTGLQAVQYSSDGFIDNGGGVSYTTYDMQSTLQAPSNPTPGNYVIQNLPYCVACWSVHSTFVHNGDIWLTLKRKVTRQVIWRGQPVTASFWESHVAKGNPGAMSSFVYRGRIANGADFANVKAAQPVVALRPDKDVIPTYEADNPRCVGIDATSRIICAVRTSADDDEDTGVRPLDPALIFTADEVPTNGIPHGVLSGSEVQGSPYCRGQWSYGGPCTPLDSTRIYFGDSAPIPPLLIAVSDDNGATFHRRFIADRGGVDSSLAYDPEQNVLVLAYGGLTFPRKGIAIQYSLDQGATWSQPITVAYQEGFTDGNVFVGKVGPGRFVLLYSVSPRYRTLQTSEWTSYRRIIEIIR